MLDVDGLQFAGDLDPKPISKVVDDSLTGGAAVKAGSRAQKGNT